MKKPTLIVVTALVSAVVTSLVWLGLGAAVYWYFTGSQPAFVVDVEAPDRMTVGEQGTLAISVSNPSDETLTLASIDIYDSFLDGFNVVSVTPAPSSQDHTFDFSSFYSTHDLKPSDSVDFEFLLEAVSPGVWTGDIDCCTPLEQFVTTSTTIVIEE